MKVQMRTRVYFYPRVITQFFFYASLFTLMESNLGKNTEIGLELFQFMYNKNCSDQNGGL
jgi:hypothetical protein